MRILVVGAGAVGGYFGGRLLASGRDVTFLVRPRRAEALARAGLSIRSPVGDVHLPDPPTVTADAVGGAYDLVLLSCKSYDLEGAVASFAPAVGPGTLVLPLLNGMGHLEVLEERFGAERVLGGLCYILASLDAEGRVLHLGPVHVLAFGARHESQRSRVQEVERALSGAGFDARASDAILREMWEKWVFIATVAGVTSLMRANIGDVIEAGGTDLITGMLDECAAVAARSGSPASEAALQRYRGMLTQPGSNLAASLFRDLERGGPTEADHILGDLLRRADPEGQSRSLLRIAWLHTKAYDARRTREAEPAAT